MNEVLDAVWERVVGGLDWLKQVVFGEFEDNRDLSAVIADMLLSFVPGVVIVTSARDLTAVILRLAKRPERRDQVEEWMLLIACAIPLVLPVLAAAAGAAAAGVGAVIGGIAGSEAGAVLRAVCLLLIKKGAHVLAEVVGFLRRFIKGDILKVLRDIQFVKYSDALVKYVGDFIGKLIGIVQRVRVELLKVDAFHWLADVLQRLEELERSFYAVQTSAMRTIPKALVELDLRLQQMLSEALPHGPRPAMAGVPAGQAAPVPVRPERVPAMPGNPLGRPEGTNPPGHAPRGSQGPNLHPEHPREPKLGTMPEKKVPCFKSDGLPAGKATEMERQLAGQQAGLNNMTVQEYLEGRERFKQFGRGSGKPAADARAAYEKKVADELTKQYRDAGMSPAEAGSRAKTEAADRMKTLAALHNPDMVAGGNNAIDDMGDRGVNSSIGSQWKGRVGDLDKAALDVPANQRAGMRMNAKLERCK